MKPIYDIPMIIILFLKAQILLADDQYQSVSTSDCQFHIIIESLLQQQNFQMLSHHQFFEKLQADNPPITITHNSQIENYFYQNRYLSYKTRYALSACIIVILETTTPETLLTTVQKSGFLSSDYSIFVKISQKLNDVNGLVPSLMSILNTPLIEFTVESNTISIFCPDGYDISSKQFPVSQNRYQLCKSHLVETEGILDFTLLHRKTVEKVLRLKTCISRDRQTFFKTLLSCQNGYMIGFMISAKEQNVSFSAEEASFEEDDEENLLQVYWLPTIYSNFDEKVFVLGTKMKLLAQTKMSVFYAGLMNGEITRRLEQHVSIFEYKVWAAIIAAILLISFVYKNIFQALDLFWLLVGQSLMYTKHWRVVVTPFMIGAIFIAAIYSAGFSSENLLVKYPTTLHELAQKGYKFHMRYSKIIKFQFLVPEGVQKAFSKAFEVQSFADEMLSSKGYVRSRSGQVRSLSENLAATVNKRSLGLGNSGKPVFSTSPFLSKVLSITDKVIVEDTYLCGSIAMPDYVLSYFNLGYQTWGRYSKQLNRIFGNLDEMGIISILQFWVYDIHYLKDKTSWSPLKSNIGRTVPLPLSSPLGVAIIAQFCACLTILFPWLLFWIAIPLSGAKNYLRPMRCVIGIFKDFFVSCCRCYSNAIRNKWIEKVWYNIVNNSVKITVMLYGSIFLWIQKCLKNNEERNCYKYIARRLTNQ